MKINLRLDNVQKKFLETIFKVLTAIKFKSFQRK